MYFVSSKHDYDPFHTITVKFCCVFKEICCLYKFEMCFGCIFHLRIDYINKNKMER